MAYDIEPLGPQHDRGAFCCGNDHLDAFCKESLDEHLTFRKRIHVACEDDSEVVIGYYCLSLYSIRAGKAKSVGDPAIHLHYLAVDLQHQGRGIGRLLMRHALSSVYDVAQLAGATWLTLDAVDKRTAGYYRALGFEWLDEDRLKMFIPIETIVKLVEQVRTAAKG